MFCSRYRKLDSFDLSVEGLQQAIDDVNRNYTMVIPVVPPHYSCGYSIAVNLQYNKEDGFPTIRVRTHKNGCDNVQIFVKVTINDNPITIGARAFDDPNFSATILVGVDSLPRIYDSEHHYHSNDVNRIFSTSILDGHVTLLDAMKTCSIPVFPETWRVVPGDHSLCTFTLCTNKSVVCCTDFDAYTIDDFSDLDVAASKTGVSETKYIVLPTRGCLNTIRGLVINPIGSPDFGYVPLYCIGLDSDPNMRLPPANFRFMPLSTIQEL